MLEVVRKTGYQPTICPRHEKAKDEYHRYHYRGSDQFSSPPIIERIMAYCGYELQDDPGQHAYVRQMAQYMVEDEKKLQSVLQPAIQELLSIKVDGIIYVAGHGRIINCFPMISRSWLWLYIRIQSHPNSLPS